MWGCSPTAEMNKIYISNMYTKKYDLFLKSVKDTEDITQQFKKFLNENDFAKELLLGFSPESIDKVLLDENITVFLNPAHNGEPAQILCIERPMVYDHCPLFPPYEVTVHLNKINQEPKYVQ